MKVCPKCKKGFSTSSSYCPPCLTRYQKEKGYNVASYKKNKERIKARLKNNGQRRREEVRLAKAKPCADCGVQYSYRIMQFDHVHGKKEFNIGQRFYRNGIKRIREEIAKCEVVCSNCHADRTYKRLNAS
jgi:hypothetical protein